MKLAALFLGMLVAAGLARASHPLITEDTGVLGAGVWQLELHGEAIRGERDQAAAVLAYGVAASADLQLEAPRDGDAALSLKWRFYEAGPVSLVLKPDVTGSGWGASFAAGCELGAFELLGHLGYARAGGESSRHASVRVPVGIGVVRDVERQLQARSRRQEDRGIIYALARDIELGFGRKGGDERAWLLGAKLRW